MSEAPSVWTQSSDDSPDDSRAKDSSPRSTQTRSPRLARLRRDLIDAPYELCTQKAELLTDYFRDSCPADPLGTALARGHFALVRRALARSLASGSPQKRWQLRLGNALQRLYARREAARRREAPVVEYARALAYTLERVPLRIYEHELVVGNPSSRRIGAPIHPDLGGLLLLPEIETLSTRPVNPLRSTAAQRRRLKEEIFPFWFSRSVQARSALLTEDPELANVLLRGQRFVLTQFAGISHLTPDYQAVLEKGFDGILEEVSDARRRPHTQEQEALYRALEIAARAASAFGSRWSEFCAREAEREKRPQRAAELRELAKILARVPARPARSFHEALQSLFLTHVIVHQESFQHGVSFGRIDQILLPYYRSDLEAGRIGPARAVELLGCFLGKAAELLPLFNQMATEYFSGLSSASGLTLGGIDAEGRDASNELSFLVLEAYDQMRLRQPNLHVRIHENSEPRFVARAHEIVKGGGGMPAFFNDDAVVPALERQGCTPQHARDYSIVGCVEWSVPARSFPAAGACFLSLPAALDRALHGGASVDEGGRAKDFASLAEVFEAFERELRATVLAAVAGNDAIERAHAASRPTPLLSLLVEGCITSGVELNAGGALYNSTGLQGVGLADVADSLAAIETLVFEQERVDLPELMAAVDADFVGADALRARLRELAPHYGQDRGIAERWAQRVTNSFCQTVSCHTNPRGGRYAPGFWTMTTHIGFGRRLGALPSGRRAGEPLADGISPSNGCDTRGPTASMLAAAQLGSARVGNGLCLNEKIAPWLVAGPEGTRTLTALTRGYFGAGGMQVQYNVIDPAVLMDAKRNPERHRDLVVRISGYSAYFNDLTEEMKDDIIARVLHGPESLA